MRTHFTIVALLGLFMFGYSLRELRAVRQFQWEVRGVQASFREWVSLTRDRHSVYTGTDPETIIAPLNGIENHARAWCAVSALGAAVFVCGVSGVWLGRLQYVVSGGD
jgi:hypothetical protein